MPQGKFIVFEGGEGSGKTTHVRAVVEYLQQKKLSVVTTHEPGGTEIGKHIRQILLENSTDHQVVPLAELFLFLADRAQHIQTYIQPQLHNGQQVVCDRFTGSTLAYQIGARKLEPEALIMEMEALARSNLQPDLVIYLDVSPDIGIQRKRQQIDQDLTRFDNEAVQFHEQVNHYFRQLARTQPHWIQIDANRDLTVVQQDINRQLDKLFHEYSN